MKNSLIILSGGMDSVTLLHQYSQDIALAVSFDYNSKHNYRELPFASYNADLLGIPHHIITMPFINTFFSSALLKNGKNIPDGHFEDESMKETVIPFRNGIMLSIAIGIAESNDLNTIFIGNHAGDRAIYPDCRIEFMSAMNTAAMLGTYKKISIESPYQKLTKRDIALTGKHYKVDYSKTWTCYKGRDLHCGKCGSCTERKEALQGFDTTIYES